MVLESTIESQLTPFVSHDVAKPKPDAAAAAADIMNGLMSLDEPGLEDHLEAIAVWAQRCLGTSEIVAAAEQFASAFGKVFHDDSFYSMRTSYFFAHFLFERPLPAAAAAALGLGEDSTPFELFLAQVQRLALAGGTAAKVMGHLTDLRDFRHTVMQITKLQEKTMQLQDLLQPGRMSVRANPQESFRGLDRSHLLQGFVFRFGDSYRLSGGLILHPAKTTWMVKRFIAAQRRRGNLQPGTLTSRLAVAQLRYMRLRHVDPKTIYKPELNSLAAARS